MKNILNLISKNENLFTHTECFILAAVLGITIITVIIYRFFPSLRLKVKRSPLIYYKDFNDKWIEKSKRKGGVGYKYEDKSGCYVITIYKHKLTAKFRYMRFEDVYVGQSQDIYWRVHNHFNAKGNGRIYGSIMAEKKVFVKFFPCKKKAMNNLERELIEYFHAEKSFNYTAGGGKKRRSNR